MSVESTVRAVTTYRLAEMKQRGEKIAMLTSYDYSMARIVDAAGLDVLLVGHPAATVLAGCDAGRLAGFDPLFEGGEKNPGSAALAARAALLPHLFLQALVRRALTGPLVPEVIE